MIRVLYIGDVVGEPGRRALHERLERVVDREKIDFTIVNVENAAGGFGVTEAIIEELDQLPINAYTSGNQARPTARPKNLLSASAQSGSGEVLMPVTSQSVIVRLAEATKFAGV